MDFSNFIYSFLLKFVMDEEHLEFQKSDVDCVENYEKEIQKLLFSKSFFVHFKIFIFWILLGLKI